MTHMNAVRCLAGPLAVALAIAVAGCQPGTSSDPLSARPGESEQQTTPAALTTSVDGLSYPGPGTDMAMSAPSRPANHGPYPPPDTAATAETLPAVLAAALRDCDAEALAQLTASHFSHRAVPGGGVDVVSDYGLGQFFAGTLCQPSNEPVVFTEQPTSLRPVTETLRGAYNPAMAVEAVLFTRGRGADGKAEARLVLLRDTDGSVYFGAAEVAPGGFDAPDVVADDATRTVLFNHGHGLWFEVEIPAKWHTERSGDVETLMSYLPYGYAFEDRRPSKGMSPGETKIEFYPPDGGGIQTIDETIASTTYYDEAPKDRDVQRIALSDGKEAVLARFTFASTAYMTLYVPTNYGQVHVPCWGDQAPCEAILRTVRIK